MLRLLLLAKWAVFPLSISYICLCMFVLSSIQLQNSRTVIQERDRVIRDLEEKVAFLEAEVRKLIKLQLQYETKQKRIHNLMFWTPYCLQNREMHDHMEYFLAGQDPPPLKPTENKPEVVYRWVTSYQFLFVLIFSFTVSWEEMTVCLSTSHTSQMSK